MREKWAEGSLLLARVMATTSLRGDLHVAPPLSPLA